MSCFPMSGNMLTSYEVVFDYRVILRIVSECVKTNYFKKE